MKSFLERALPTVPKVPTVVASGFPRNNQTEPGLKMPITYNSVTIHLFEAKDLPVMDRNQLSDPFCKFRLGSEKFRSRVIKKTLNPQWMEQFEIFLYEYDCKRLEISIWDWDRMMKNELIGRVDVDLAVYEKGETYDLWLDVKDKGVRRGSVHLSVLVNASKEIEDFAKPTRTQASPVYVDSEMPVELPFSPPHPTGTAGKVGSLSVQILTITNLAMSDCEGRSLYCVLQLGLVRVQTHTIPKTANPEWNCHYNFPVEDIHSVLEISLMDRDAKSRTTLLGSLAVPLLNVKPGMRRLYTLKDKKLMKNTVSSILLEFQLDYDVIQAALQTVRPKDDVPSDLDKKISSQVLVNKVVQIRKLIVIVSGSLAFVQSLLAWESIQNSMIAYLLYVLIVMFAQPHWIPFFMLLVFLKNYAEKQTSTGGISVDSDDDVDSLYSTSSEASSNVTLNSRAKFSSAEELIQLIPASINPVRLWSKYVNRDTGRNIVTSVKTAHDQARFVQQVLEFFAEQYEKIVNTFNFTVPWLSYFAILALIGLFFALYIFQLRWVLLAWGTFEFGKGFCGIRGFQLLAFLSRVHSKHEARMYAENAAPL